MQANSPTSESSWTAGKEFHLRSPTATSGPNFISLLDRSTDAKTGQYHLANYTLPPSVHLTCCFPTDWQIWIASTLTDQSLRTTMIGLVKKFASSRINNLPFPDRYNSTSGQMNTLYDRTVVGGHFGIVCFALPPKRLGLTFLDLFRLAGRS